MCLLFLMIAVGWGWVQCGQAPAEEESTGSNGKPRIHALLIGVTEYPEFKKAVSASFYNSRVKLDGPENDVALFKQTLIEYLGARESDIIALAGWPDDAAKRPTGANIRKALEALATRSYGKDDRVVVLYAGHGVQVPDDNGDELDAQDEAWLPADGTKDAKKVFAGALRDEVIGDYLKRIRDKGATVWCIMDCCHSSTGVRGTEDEPVKTRGLLASDLGIETKGGGASRGFGADEGRKRGEGKDYERLVVFYAAQSHQEVPELLLPRTGADRKTYGLLTTSIVRALQKSGDQLTFAGLFEQVAAGYRSLRQQNRVQPDREGDLQQRVFGGSRAASVPLFVRNVDGKSLQLSAGAVHGISVGTELDVFEAGQVGSKDHHKGTVKVVRVGPSTSQVKTTGAGDKTWARTQGGRWPAEVAVYMLGPSSLALAVVDAEDTLVPKASLSEAVRTTLDRSLIATRFPLVTDKAKAKWVLEVDAEKKPVALRPALHAPDATRYDVGDDLEQTLMRIFRAENLLRLAGSNPRKLPRNLALHVSRRETSKNKKRLASGARVAPGTILDFGFIKEKGSSRGYAQTIDLFVFWVDPNLGVMQLYPVSGETPRLAPGDHGTAATPIALTHEDGVLITDTGQGTERLVVIVSPRMKSTPPLDLSFLQQPPLQEMQLRDSKSRGDGKQDPIAKLLGDLALGAESTRSGMTRVKHKDAPLYMGVFSFESGWKSPRLPAASKGQPTASIEATRTRALTSEAPDPWDFHGEATFAQAGEDSAWCLLTAKTPGAFHVMVDLDEELPASKRTAEALRLAHTKKTFDAELVIRVETKPPRRIAWYDQDNDGTFDLILIAEGNGRNATKGLRRSGEGWEAVAKLGVPLLSTSHMPWVDKDSWDDMTRVLGRMATVAGD